MSQWLFNEHLLSAKRRGLRLLQEDVEQIEEEDEDDLVTSILTNFACMLSEDEVDDPTNDLEGTFDEWCMSTGELSESDTELLKQVLSEVAREAYGKANDENIRGVLRILKTTPATSYTTPNQSGLQPLPGETGVRAFLKQLRVAKHADAFGNDDVFQAKDVNVFHRAKHRYGHPYTDFNNQRSTQTALKNPTLNVHSEAEEPFTAIDSVGLGINVHYRVLNTLTGEYLTKKIDKRQAESVASDLNSEYRRVLLGEIETPLQEEYTLPALPIQESLRQPLNPAYAAYLNKSNPAWTMGGNLHQSNHQSTVVSDFKAAQLLIERRKEKFGENENRRDEFDAIRAVQQRAVKR